MWKIIGTYQGNTEEIDEADTREEADRLVAEYRIAFGKDWYIRRSRGRMED